MEKLVSRPSGGGAKLGTLDMQSYLEVMGRQLAEIQAQHQQFYASRQDRLGRLRHTDHGQVKRCSSESNGGFQPAAGQASPEDQGSARDPHAHDPHAQSPVIAGGGSRAPAGARFSSATHGGARRSLNFGDESPGDDVPGMDTGGVHRAAGRSRSTAGSKRQQELRAFSSTPPLTGFGFAPPASTGAAAGGPLNHDPYPAPSSGRVHAAHDPSPKHSTASPLTQPSSSAVPSISPSSASFRPPPSTPGTPSISTTQTGATDPGTESTLGMSPAGPYAVYDVSDVTSVSYATPDAHDDDSRLAVASLVSGSSSGTLRGSLGAAAAVGSPIPTPGRAVLKGISDVTPSAASGSSSALAMREHGQDMSPGECAAASDEEGVAIALSLVGRAFDGIDSEEDDEAEPCMVEPAGGGVGTVGHLQHTQRHRLARVSGVAIGMTAAAVGGGDDPAAASLAPEGETCSAGGRPSSRRISAVQHADASTASATGSRSQPRAPPRAPLVAASLETEEALRALLSSPRLAATAMDMPVGASIDVEGIEVPDDVLAALAKTDGMDLDAALGAAVAATLRGGQQAPGQERLASAAGRAAGQGQGSGPGAPQLPPGGPSRHLVLGPGALTAVPPSVAVAGASRGFDSSIRSTGSAAARHACGLGPQGPAAAAAGEPPPQRSAQYHYQHHPPAALSSAGVSVDASIEVDGVDLLSQTIEIASDGLRSDPGVRDSVAVAAMAIAAQRAAAQQHVQPVLYSVVPARASEAPSSRRSTMDGESRRGTTDGEGRRITFDGGESRGCVVDGSALSSEAIGEQASVSLDAGPPAAAALSGGTSSSASSRGGPGARPLGQSGRGAEAAGGVAAASPSRALPRGAVTAASPSSLLRQGGDADTVLYGSPSNRNSAAAVDTAGGPSPGGAGSTVPHVAPGPPLGADAASSLHSPPSSHAGSRLQRNSRNSACGEDLPANPQPLEDAGLPPKDGDDALASAAAAGALLRPWSGAAGGSSRRLIHQHLAGSGSGASSNGPSSANLDLSLTQAAAAAALGSLPRAHHTGAVPSPTGSQRHLRSGVPTPLQVSPGQPRQQQQQEGAHQPAYSAFSLVELSPSAARGAQVASYDLSVDDTGRPMSPSQSAKAEAATAGSVATPLAAASAGGAGSARDSLAGGQQQPQQQQLAVAPPLAAFSRAAALAAAADLGLPAPPANPVERRTQPMAGSGAGPLGTGAAAGRSAAGSAGGLEGRAWESLAPDSSREEPQGGARAREHFSGDRGASSGVPGDPAGGALALAQSPGLSSVAAGSAKLSQLKARRQQQWQSQQGLQPGESMSMPTGGAAAALPPDQQQQQSGPPDQPHPGSTHQHSHLNHPGHGDGPVSSSTASVSGRGFESPGPSAALGPSRFPPPASGSGAPGGSPLPAPTSPLLPQAVVEAIATATIGGKEAVRGELNLGHGISGLSVAIEAGQVKWAWQTEVKGRAVEAGGSERERSPAAGADDASAGSTPAASPSSAHNSARDSGSEWALQHLPPPQWQRHGQLPPAGGRVGHGTGGGHGTLERSAQPATAATPQPHPQAQAPLEPPQPDSTVNWRRPEYNLPERKAVTSSGSGPQHYYSAGGGAGGGGASSGQGQDRDRTAFRNGTASDAGAHGGGKALALLRLKQQSIMRHNVSVPGGREPEGQSSSQPAEQPHQRQAPPGAPQSPQPFPLRAGSAAASQHASHSAHQQQPQRRTSAPRMPHSIAEHPDPRQQASRVWLHELEEGGFESQGAGGSQVQPKAYLRRRSAKVQPRKVDWSHVKPRTNSRNPDYYVDPSPEVYLRARISPLSSPRGGVAKPPLGVSAGGSIRAKKPAAKVPYSPSDEDKAMSLAAAAVPRRRASNIPPPPAVGPGAGQGPAAAPVDERRAGAAGAAAVGAVGRGGMSPLDDLLAHVNTLLRDFDKVVM